MELIQKQEDGKLVVVVKGRLDTVTAPDLQHLLESVGAASQDAVLDFAALDYISSAGLRVLLAAHKKARAGGGALAIAHANAAVRDVFDMTGFSDILTLV